MATLSELVNLGSCGSDFVGFSTAKGCAYRFADTKEIWRTPADFQFDETQEFNAAYIKSLQLAGTLSIIKGITDFPETGTDPLIETLPDNTELSAGDAKYKYSPVFTNSLWFNKLLGYLRGQGNNRFIFVDSSGNMLMTEGTSKGKTRGFLTSRTERGKLTLQSPGVGQKQMLDFQLANTFELEDNFVLLQVNNFDFQPRLIEGVTQSYLEFSAVPQNLNTTVQVKAVVDQGRKIAITGATNPSNWTYKVNNTEVTVTGVAFANDIYTLTVPAVATNDNLSISFNGVIEIVGDALYRSSEATTTVIA